MKYIYVILFLLVSHLSLAQEKNLVVEYQAQTTFENTEISFLEILLSVQMQIWKKL